MAAAIGIGSPLRLVRRGGVFFELAKLKIVELWIGFFVGASLLDCSGGHSVRAVAILALILTVGVAVIAATCSLDDITGVRDGVDQANQAGGARWGVSKPILAGRLSERRAFRFVYLIGAIALVAYAGVIGLAWPLPTWLVLTMTGMIVVALNYSYGLKLSYRGGGELVIFIGGFGTVLLPYALVSGTVHPLVLLNAFLVGAWHAQVVMHSNTKDAAGDRATGRMTLAARTSKRGNKRYIAASFLLVWVVTATAFATRIAPAAYAVALAPVWALQAYQLWSGVGEERWLRARLVGFYVIRVGVVALTLVNLIVRPGFAK